MIFSIGTKVRIKHTGDIGKITAQLEHGLLQVLLEDEDMEIPVPIEALERFDANSSVKAKIVSGKQEKKVEVPEAPPIESQYAILKSLGIQMAFEAQNEREGLPEFYTVYLLNDTQSDIIYSVEISYLDAAPLKKNGKLQAVSAQQIGMMYYDNLNDAPIVYLEIWELTTQGTGKQQSIEIKIKPKQFFNKIATAPFLNRPVHLYRLIEKVGIENKIEPQPEDDLKTYTQENATPFKKKKKSSFYQTANVEEFANFPSELDLHVERLASNTSKLSNAEKLRLQLKHFDSYLSKAIRLGVERVFIIHGVGKGKLRDNIASRLLQNPDVKSFKNEYHPRYGWGATEVIF